jgi:hypothetical protein
MTGLVHVHQVLLPHDRQVQLDDMTISQGMMGRGSHTGVYWYHVDLLCERFRVQLPDVPFRHCCGDCFTFDLGLPSAERHFFEGGQLLLQFSLTFVGQFY